MANLNLTASGKIENVDEFHSFLNSLHEYIEAFRLSTTHGLTDNRGNTTRFFKLYFEELELNEKVEEVKPRQWEISKHNQKIGFWFKWDEDTTYYTLQELNTVDEQLTGGLTNYLWTLREILEKHWREYQKSHE